MHAKRLLPWVARSGRWRVPVAVSLAAHAVLIAFAWTAWQAGQQAAPISESVMVRMIEWVAPAPPAVEQERRRPREPDRRPAQHGVTRTPPSEDSQALPVDAVQPAEPFADSPATAAPPATPALDPDSIQRAARQAARSRSLVQQSNDLIGTKPPPTAQEQLGAQVARSAKGDCLKGGEGGYEKQGLGLLGIPFLIVDAATGNCRK